MISRVQSPEKRLAGWLHPFIFAAWTGYLIYLMATQHYVAFLRPEFGLLLALAHFIALGFLLTAMVHRKMARVDGAAVLRGLVLLTPILYAMVMPDTMLGNQAFKKRFVGATAGTPVESRLSPAPQTPAPASEAEAEQSQVPPALAEELESARQTLPREQASEQQVAEQTILDLFLNSERYQGRQVAFIGMILRDEQLKPHFGGRDTAIYRFLINCCAADALPLAVVLSSGLPPDQSGAFANDQWVRVEGRFELEEVDGKPIAMVSDPVIQPVKAPKVPYLF